MYRNKNTEKDLEIFSDLKINSPEKKDADVSNIGGTSFTSNINKSNTNRTKHLNEKKNKHKLEKLPKTNNDNHLQYMEIYNLKFQHKSTSEVIIKSDEAKKKIARLYKRFAEFRKKLVLMQKGKNQLNNLIKGKYFEFILI